MNDLFPEKPKSKVKHAMYVQDVKWNDDGTVQLNLMNSWGPLNLPFVTLDINLIVRFYRISLAVKRSDKNHGHVLSSDMDTGKVNVEELIFYFNTSTFNKPKAHHCYQRILALSR